MFGFHKAYVLFILLIFLCSMSTFSVLLEDYELFSFYAFVFEE